FHPCRRFHTFHQVLRPLPSPPSSETTLLPSSFLESHIILYQPAVVCDTKTKHSPESVPVSVLFEYLYVHFMEFLLLGSVIGYIQAPVPEFSISRFKSFSMNDTSSLKSISPFTCFSRFLTAVSVSFTVRFPPLISASTSVCDSSSRLRRLLA